MMVECNFERMMVGNVEEWRHTMQNTLKKKKEKKKVCPLVEMSFWDHLKFHHNFQQLFYSIYGPSLSSMYQRRRMKLDHHAKFRWNKWCCVGVTLVLLLPIVLLFDFTPYSARGTHTHNRINTVMDDICAKIKNEADLAAIVWSHRAALSKQPNTVDGSVENMKTLLSNGISNFDVDISILGGEGTESVSFYVAHPSRLSSAQKNTIPKQIAFQSVRPFLSQIDDYHHVSILHSSDRQKHSTQPQSLTSLHHTNRTPTNRQLRPMVTIEPKFSEPLYIQQLVRIGNNSQYIYHPR